MTEEYNLKDERKRLRQSIIIEDLSKYQILNIVERQDKEFIENLLTLPNFKITRDDEKETTIHEQIKNWAGTN
jgi:hypothetical protein